MNEFRERLLSGGTPGEPLLRSKGGKPVGAVLDPDVKASLDALAISRDASRMTNHRGGDRHRLIEEGRAVATWSGRDFEAEIINLSGGGAMIAGPCRPKLWDRVELSLGGCGTLEAVVRWIKGDRIGLEFAHETRVEADEDVRTAVLREALRRSFPESEDSAPPVAAETPDPEISGPEPEGTPRGERRHPLIWNGLVHFDYESTPVRLRNISAAGALVQASTLFPLGAEVLLDLNEGGTIFCTVVWAHGDQTGLRFKAEFDLAQLGRAEPQLTPKSWVKPDYLRDDSTETSPWASRWDRLTLTELRRTLKR